MDQMPSDKTPARVEPKAIEQAGDDLPVVARMVIEIRSDGSRTVARGAIEDVQQGVKVGLEAKGTTPMELARTLTRSMLELPLLRTADRVLGAWKRGVKALLPGRK
jgi:hypothetical protein